MCWCVCVSIQFLSYCCSQIPGSDKSEAESSNLHGAVPIILDRLDLDLSSTHCTRLSLCRSLCRLLFPGAAPALVGIGSTLRQFGVYRAEDAGMGRLALVPGCWYVLLPSNWEQNGSVVFFLFFSLCPARRGACVSFFRSRRIEAVKVVGGGKEAKQKMNNTRPSNKTHKMTRWRCETLE